MKIERWALPLLKSVGLVPKSSKIIARSRIKCASCKICSYHLGLESPDLSPPLKTCTSVTSATVPTTSNACLKQAAATPLKGKLLMPMIYGPALSVSIWINMKKKASIHFQKREIVQVSWNPTWEPEDLQNTCGSFKKSLKKFEEQITAPNLPQPAPENT